MAECLWCLADVDEGETWCSTGECETLWRSLFADPVHAEPPDDVYDDERDTLLLDH
jgi:hypothetical protein